MKRFSLRTKRAALALAFLLPACASVFAADPLAELRKSFTLSGKPIPPEIFADFGDAMMSDSRPIIVAIDARAAIDSNRYADAITKKGDWVEQAKPGPGGINGPGTMAYEYRGETSDGLLVFLAAWSSGGSGTFYWLHILDAADGDAFDEDGAKYRRLDLKLVRSFSLGDRWSGEISVSGATIKVVTRSSLGGHVVSPVTIEARRP